MLEPETEQADSPPECEGLTLPINREPKPNLVDGPEPEIREASGVPRVRLADHDSIKVEWLDWQSVPQLPTPRDVRMNPDVHPVQVVAVSRIRLTAVSCHAMAGEPSRVEVGLS